MIGICIEAGLTCPGCETFVPVNAMVPSLECTACGRNIPLSPENWSTILEQALKEAAALDEGEGRKMTVFGGYSFRITYGRQSPRFSGTKETIGEDLVLASLECGFAGDGTGSEKTVVRPLPVEYSEQFPGVVALVGEDPVMLPGRRESADLEHRHSGQAASRSKPVAFQCPGCGGSLILDGTSRTAACSYCNSSVYLPDDLWSTLHPVRSMRRWYLLLDEAKRPVQWEREVWDAARDSLGNYYMILEPGIMGKPLLVSTGPDRDLRWRRSDLDLEPATSRGDPKLAVTPGGMVLAASGDRRKLYVISAADGSTIKVLEGSDDQAVPPHLRFGMQGCYDFGVFPDETLFLYRNCGRSDAWGSYMEFQRFDLDGNQLPMWDEAKMRFTFLERLKRMFSRNADIANFDMTPSYPVGSRDFNIRLTIGPDGSVYMLDFRSLLKLDPDGRRVYLIEELPCGYTTGRPAANREGETFIVANREGERVEILSVSPDGTGIRTEATSSVDGGPLERNGILTLSPDGSFSLLGFSGYWADMERNV